MSFWKSSDKIAIEQTKISIPSTNGLEYSSGGRILIEIPAGENGLEFFQPRETYLKFDVKFSGCDDAPKLQLDEVIGAQVLIKNIRVSSGGARNLLLEEIQDYNVLTRLKYDYETNENLRNKRGLTEGVSGYNRENRANTGVTKATCNDTGTNAYFQPILTTPTADWGDDNQKTAKVLLPLNTGIFNNDKIFPIGLTEGLRIEIDLEDKKSVFRGLDSMALRRSLRGNPVFHSRDGGASSGADWANGALTDTWYFQRDNCNLTSWENLPFHQGQKVGLVKGDMSAGIVTTATGAWVIDSISASATDSGLFEVKASASVTNGAGEDALTSWDTAVADRWYLVDLDAETNTSFAPAYTISNVEMIIQQVGMPQGYTAKMRSMMKEGGVMNYDFLSFTNYKYSQQLSDRVMNMRLPIGNSRAKAILCVPTDSTVRNVSEIVSGAPTTNTAHGTDNSGDPYEVKYTTTNADVQYISNSPALTGCWDYMTDYQFFYDGKMNPSRPVECAKISLLKSVEQQPLIELEKALVVSDIQPMSFRAFQSNCCIGRALSTGDGVYDCRGKDFNVQVNYREGSVGWRPACVLKNGAFSVEKTTLATPRLPHLWMNFVSHIRRLSFKGDQIMLEV